jgi:hypothetical protein
VAVGAGLQRLASHCEGRLKGVADDLVDEPTAAGHRFMQDGVVTVQRRLHRLGLALPQGRAAFDVGIQERDRTAWEMISY